MNPKRILFIAAAFLLIPTALFVSEGWIYLLTALAAVTIVTVIRHLHSPVMKFTRWAKENPGKTQALITVLQISILSSGLVVGYDLKQLGYQFSEVPIFIFGATLSIGFCSTRFLPKNNTIALPTAVNRDRIAYMSIALSAFVIMLITGNRIETKYPNSYISRVLKSIDQSMFSEDNFLNDATKTGLSSHAILLGENVFASIAVNGAGYSIHPNKEAPSKMKADRKVKRFEKRFEKRKQRIMKRIENLRRAFAGGVSAGVVFLIILLVIAACAGICIALSGGGAGSVFLGIIILGLAVFGIVKLVGKKRTQPPKKET